MEKLNAISLFSGAGGMDVGFQAAGFHILWANEKNKDAALTYKKNHPNSIISIGDLNDKYEEITQLTSQKIDLVFGGPPCQGFSVAGKMEQSDDRNQLIFSFLKVVGIVKPKVFVMENVKALATLEKWAEVRKKYYEMCNQLGYTCFSFVLNATEFGVPQKRERVFFIGFKNQDITKLDIQKKIEELKVKSKSIRESIGYLGPAGTEENPLTCTAKISFATNPILRKSPYAGMLFNGAGRPIELDAYANTLPASMGGNKTPIIDEDALYGQESNWVELYHHSLFYEQKAALSGEVPKRLRRLTIKEAALIQTFPKDYIFEGKMSSVYTQIGNAVPCLLAEKVAIVAKKIILSEIESTKEKQLSIEEFCELKTS